MRVAHAHEGQFTQSPAIDDFFDGNGGGVIAPEHVDHKGDVGLFGGGYDGIGFVQGGSDDFFGENMLACLGCR